MSMRALRKLVREQEQNTQLAALQAGGKGEGESIAGSEEEESLPSISKAKVKKKRKQKSNAFQMLEQEDDEEDIAPELSSDKESLRPEAQDMSRLSTPQSTKPKRKKKRKAKNRGKDLDSPASRKIEGDGLKENSNEVDEIDRALKELNTRNSLTAQQETDHSSKSQEPENSWEKEISKLLAVETRNLNPTTEMKSLFGSIALERTSRNQARPDEEGRVDLETALNGRHNPASRGKELGSLATRRNIFMQGQESWPLAMSGGLGMEYVKESGNIGSTSASMGGLGKHYEIVHNTSYQDTQRQFRQAVQSMSAEVMIHLLVHNPYHIATLLQVAEIAKHQGDHSVTGDLLERALFTFGRSVHSTFGVSVREGRARLAFDQAANRELYLAIWRYIQNLEMRGTWRTAFEWSKILLSFNILSDPYGVTHVLDQYALRGRQHDALIELCSEEAFGNTWSHLPNMQISLALAYHRASRPKLARQKLALAMHRYPYILSHLCSALDISPLPKSLWGITPSTDAEKLYTELYVTRAKDLWTTPETTALLAEVAETLDSYSQFWKNAPPAPKLEVSLEDARHIFLLDIPALIALIPRNLRSLPTAQYDVLPPPSSTTDAGFIARAPATADGPNQRGPMGFLAELMRAASRDFLGIGTASAASDNNNPDPQDEEDEVINNINLLNTTLADANLSPEDRTAILAALAENENSDTDLDSDTFPEEDEEEEQQQQQRQPGEMLLPSFFLPASSIPTTLPEPHPTAARSIPVPNRDAQDGIGSADTDPDDALLLLLPPPPPDHQHRPTTSGSPPPPPPPPPPPARVPGAGPPPPPPAPTVQDEDDDDDDAPDPASGPRVSPSQNPPPRQQQQQQPPLPNPQRIQRFLLSAGLAALQAGTPGAMEEYVRHLRLLRSREREWVLGVVGQRVGAGGAAGLVGRVREAM